MGVMWETDREPGIQRRCPISFKLHSGDISWQTQCVQLFKASYDNPCSDRHGVLISVTMLEFQGFRTN